MYMEDTAEELHRGLVVRTTSEYLLIWSTDHDLVRAPENGLKSQWPIGTWVQYKAIAEGSTPDCVDQDAKNTFTVYEISRVRNNCSLPEINVRGEKESEQIELNIFVYGPLRHLDTKRVLADDHFLGPILCESNAELIRKFNDGDVPGFIELKVVFSEEFPDIARFVAIAFRDESSEKWIELQNLTSLAKNKEPTLSAKKALGTLAISKQMDEDAKATNQKSFGTMSKLKQTDDIEEDGLEGCLPSTSNKLQMPDERSNSSNVSTDDIFSVDETVLNKEKIVFTNTSWDVKFKVEDEGGESASESNYDKEEKIIAELAHYQKEHFGGSQRRKRSFGLVVEKMLDYAVVYSKKFGLAILPSSRFSSLQQFDSICVVGNWLLTIIVEVPDSRGLTFTHMCLPPFQQADQKNVKTDVNSAGRVKILLNCDFSIINLKSLTEGQYVLSTELGDVLVSEIFIRQHGIFENVSNVWVRYIGGKYFFWEIDAEAKLATDSEDEIVLFPKDEPNCDSIAKELASVNFTCDADDPSYGVAAELASVFASDVLSNGNPTKSTEGQIVDAADDPNTENKQNNCGSHNGMDGGDSIVGGGNEDGSTVLQAEAAAMNDTVLIDQTPSDHQQQPQLSQNDFSSIYNYAKSFWPRLCRDKTGERPNALMMDGGNTPKCSNSEVEQQ